MSFVYIARQPIYTARLDVYAYELLYRAGDVTEADVSDGDAATAAVLLTALTEIGLSNLVGDRPAFVNMTRAFLVEDLHLLIDRDCVVLEILEDVVVDDAMVAGVAALAAQGYRIALDDFVHDPSYDALLRVADIVKLDVQAHDAVALREQVELLGSYDVELLAEKVETAEEFERCRALGFRYFQGYWLSRPAIVRGRELSANKVAMVQLLAEMQRPDADVARLAAIISRDVALSYKVLRFVNSAYLNLANPIESVHHGIVLLGLDTVRRWANLLVMARAEDKPRELMTVALARGRACERLALVVGGIAADGAFTVGLFSVLDALLDVPMDEVLHDLPLDPDVEAALLYRAGPLGRILECVCRYETGAWAQATHESVSAVDLRDAYVESLTWSAATLGALGA